MASLRITNSASSLMATRRLAHHTFGPAHASPVTILPRHNLASPVQARFQSSSSSSSSPARRITAFEQAMQEIHGDSWKQRLNHRQKAYVNLHERLRKKFEEKLAGQEPPPPDMSESDWRKKVQTKKEELLWKAKNVKAVNFPN